MDDDKEDMSGMITMMKEEDDDRTPDFEQEQHTRATLLQKVDCRGLLRPDVIRYCFGEFVLCLEVTSVCV